MCLAVLIVFPFNGAFADFSDVTAESSLNYGAIKYLESKGVISGYPDGTFRPEQTINRAEALKMVMLATGKDGESTEEIDFPDVSAEDWFFDYVRKAVEIGLVEGYKDGSFKPADNINIAESLKIIILAFDKEVGDAPAQKPYPDVEVTDWYAAYAAYSKNRQVAECGDDGLLDGGRDITRGEFAEIIYRMMYTEEFELEKFPLSTNWPVYADADLDFQLKHPADWKVIKAGDQVIFWKRDDINEQLSWARVLPLSATVVAAVEPNAAGYTVKEYVDLLEYGADAKKNFQELNGYPFASIAYAESGINDYFFELPGKKILALYTQVGSGDNLPLLGEKIRYMVGSVKEYTGEDTSPSTIDAGRESFLSEVRKLILVADKGTTVLDMFDDELLVETDSIGIGTGPVDYYYSAAYDVTIKLERNSDTILAMNDGNSTAF